MKILIPLLCCLLGTALGQSAAKPAPSNPADYSGMYTFLEEGEFVQITVEDQGNVTGFISRYGDLPSDKGAFLDQFFKKASLEGEKLTFITEPVHGTWFEFRGVIGRGDGKTPNDEGYYIAKGTLIQYKTDPDKKTTGKSREVTLKSFPQDVAVEPAKRD